MNEPETTRTGAGRPAVTALAWGMALALLGRRALQVEDGQFTREYSRIFTALILGIAFVLLLVIGAGVAGLLRSRN